LTADPSKGVDPRDSGSWNKYSYAGGDPINFNDPSGLARCFVTNMFITNADPNNALAQVTYLYVQCTSAAAGITMGEWIVSYGDWHRDAQAEEQTLGRAVDALEQLAFDTLLKNSIGRVQGYLTNSNCAKDYGNAQAAINKANSIHFANLGYIEVEIQNGRIVPHDPRHSPPVAWDTGFGIFSSISLNSMVDWLWPNNTFAIIVGGPLNGAQTMYDLLAASAYEIGVPVPVTAAQFMDITLLHELEHFSRKLGNPDDPTIERQLWNDCVR
jgi:hypothetical protein